MHAFLELLPDWDELSQGLNAIVLAEREPGADGWHDLGTVAVCAWDEDLWVEEDPDYYEEHRGIIERLGVESERKQDEYGPYVEARWTRPAARAFQLLHILLHELGHHHDRMTTRSRPDIPPRGEPYAEAYAHRYEVMIWKRYLERFGLG